MQADNLRLQAEDVQRTVIVKCDVLGWAASGSRHSAHNIIRFLSAHKAPITEPTRGFRSLTPGLNRDRYSSSVGRREMSRKCVNLHRALIKIQSCTANFAIVPKNFYDKLHY